MNERTRFIITHPFHPLKGKEFKIVDIKEYWGKKYVIFSLNGRNGKSIPIEWTNLAPQDLFIKISKGQSLFKASDLLELYHILQTLKEE